MRIFLDSRDLINLLEGRGPCSVNEFREHLQIGGHEIALSPTVVFEVAAPLNNPFSKTVVTRLLNELETLPLAYLADGQIQWKELVSGIESFATEREYTPIDPYVGRFDAAIPISGPAPTALYLNHGLAETVFMIWQELPGAVGRQPAEWVDRLQSVIAADRDLSSPPGLAHHFREKLHRDFKMYKIPAPKFPLAELADWIYASPSRCPGGRLGYEIFHHLRKNLGDQPEASDFGDFVHVLCIPYVDLITLDRRMADYVRRATRGWADDPSHKIRHDLSSIVKSLNNSELSP